MGTLAKAGGGQRPRTTAYGFTPYGSDGKLTPDSIEALARRVWWTGDGCRWEPDGQRVKWVGLDTWWPPERWPAWWPHGSWIDCGDRLEARTTIGQGETGRLEVRRVTLGLRADGAGSGR